MTALPTEGPGDRILAATRAMQSLSLEDYGPSYDVRGGLVAWSASNDVGAESWPRHTGQVRALQTGVSLSEGLSQGPAREAEQPRSVALTSQLTNLQTGISLSEGLNQGSGQNAEQPRGVALTSQVSNQLAGVSLHSQQTGISLSKEQCQKSGGTQFPGPAQSESRTSAVAGGLEAEAQGVGTKRVVKVVVNYGISKEGVFNDKGEIVLLTEPPKFYQLQDDDDAFMTPPEPPPPPPRNEIWVGEATPEAQAKGRSTNPFSVNASSPFRYAGVQWDISLLFRHRHQCYRGMMLLGLLVGPLLGLGRGILGAQIDPQPQVHPEQRRQE